MRIPTLPARSAVPQWPWPLPALVCWLLAWGLSRVLADASAAGAAATGLLLGTLLAALWPGLSIWRRLLLAAGYPLALAAGGMAAGIPGWVWLLPALALLLAYPLKAWRDAPLFSTPPGALDGLADAVPLPPGAQLLDGGCGLGQGLVALRGQYPQAALSGVEWSWPLTWGARLRCPWARVQRGDLWRSDWSGLQMIYLFQRPESMPRAWEKACAEMPPGAWLVSLDFAVPEHEPTRVIDRPGRQPVWIYRIQPPDSTRPKPRR